MKRFTAFAIAALGLAACADQPTDPTDPTAPSFDLAPAPGTVSVTTEADAGPGSFRDAVTKANGNPSVTAIRFRSNVHAIALAAPITFSGGQSLRIDGNNAEISGAALAPSQSALVADGGADLEIHNLIVRGAPGTGITVAIPAGRTGVVSIVLDEIAAIGNGLHGVLINDQAEYFNDPASTSDLGSAASVSVQVLRSRFIANGFAAIDQDGLRVNEGGAGDLEAVIRGTLVTDNGGDGIELDERSDGNADFSIETTDLLRNGAFDPSDFDDGIDVDESGAGDLVGQFASVRANANYEQGVDLNENDAGDLRVTMTKVEGSGNAEEGIEFEEDDDFAGGGDLIADLTGIVANGNGASDGDAGLKLREKGAGNLSAKLGDVKASTNHIAGVLLREDSSGDLGADLDGIQAIGNGDDGIAFDENSSGSLTASLTRSTARNNVAAGVSAEQATTGSGLLTIVALLQSGNGAGAIVVDPGVVVDRKP